MAVHAGGGGGDGGVAGLVDRGVAIQAVDAEVAGVNLVAVGNRLHGHVAGVELARMKEVPDGGSSRA